METGSCCCLRYAGGKVLELHQGPLPVESILGHWYRIHQKENFGAFITFVGTVREEGEIEGLSFDIYEPMFRKWFDHWQTQARSQGALLRIAHSVGDVPLHHSSYIAGVLSPKRRVALEMIDAFVEDFKANAPIWKYDLMGGKRLYAGDRSHLLPGSGLLKL